MINCYLFWQSTPQSTVHSHDLTNNSHFFSTLGWSLLEILQLWSMKPVQHPVHQLGKLLKLLVSSAPSTSPVLTHSLCSRWGCSISVSTSKWQPPLRHITAWPVTVPSWASLILLTDTVCSDASSDVQNIFILSQLLLIDYYCNCTKLCSPALPSVRFSWYLVLISLFVIIGCSAQYS